MLSLTLTLGAKDGRGKINHKENRKYEENGKELSPLLAILTPLHIDPLLFLLLFLLVLV